MASVFHIRLIQIVVLLIVAAEIAPADVTVKTNVGYITGTRRDVELDGTVLPIAKFLGIPYAEPPTGYYRFRLPRPKAPFTEQLMAHEHGSRCIEVFPAEGVTGSEDCLFLNVVVPDHMTMESLAVMVWIHGGGFIQGSSQDYYSDILAAFGHTIIVTVNYRLAEFGFLSTGEYGAAGNYGLWDQRLAIQWVHDNIEAFGGDKQRITIFGESAGAASVVYQGMYPGNKGLFQRIIAQSGSVTAFWAHTKDPKQYAEKVARAVGCYNESVYEMVDCLRYLHADTLHATVETMVATREAIFTPSTDNVFVTCYPSDVLNQDVRSDTFMPARQTFASFDLMVGINNKEGAISINPFYGYYGDPETFLPNRTYFDNVLVPSLFKRNFADWQDDNTAQLAINAIARQYTDNTDPGNPYTVRKQFMNMHSDAYVFSAMQTTATAHEKLSSRKTYVYYLTVNPPFHALPTPSWVEGSNHGDDIIYLFPSELYPLNENHLQLSRNMVAAWTNFAKIGDTNQPVNIGTHWDPYTASDRAYLELNVNMTDANRKRGLLEGRAEFWNKDLPAIAGDTVQPCDYEYDISGAPMLFRGFLVVMFMLVVKVLVN